MAGIGDLLSDKDHFRKGLKPSVFFNPVKGAKHAAETTSTLFVGTPPPEPKPPLEMPDPEAIDRDRRRRDVRRLRSSGRTSTIMSDTLG